MNCIDNETDEENFCKFRGIIKNPNQCKEKDSSPEYFIINEVYSSNRIRTFSGTEIVKNKIGITSVKEPRYIKYINKKFFEENILTRLNIRSEEEKKIYYHNLKEMFDNYESINENHYIQKVYNFIINDDGLYFIVEMTDYSLYDYANMIREPIKNSKYPIEIKFRPIIQSLLKGIIEIHKLGLSFCALINPHEIQIKEEHGANKKNNVDIKFPHPVFSHLAILMSLFPDEEDFPNYYPPEVYKKILQIRKRENNLQNLSSYVINWENISPFLDQNFDKWALGCLIYELIFNEKVFNYSNLEDATRKSNNNKMSMAYIIFPNKISDVCLQLIDGCLKFDRKERIQDFNLNHIYDEIVYQNSDKEKLEKILKDRLEKKFKDYSILFHTYENGSQISNIEA